MTNLYHPITIAQDHADNYPRVVKKRLLVPMIYHPRLDGGGTINPPPENTTQVQLYDMIFEVE